MFENVGEKIQKLSSVFFVIDIIAVAVLFATWLGSGLELAQIFLILLGVPCSYVLCLLMNGFGIIVSNAEKEKEKLKEKEDREKVKEDIAKS